MNIKSLDDFKNICVPQCRDDPWCTGMQFRVRVASGVCWFLEGDITYTAEYLPDGSGFYAKSSVGGYCEAGHKNGDRRILRSGSNYSGEGCLYDLACDEEFSTCVAVPPVTGQIDFRGHLFGRGFKQYAAIEIRKSLDDVKNICLPKCRNDPVCTAMQFRINARYDGRTNGNCWFMNGEIKFVDSVPQSGGGVYVKSSEFGVRILRNKRGLSRWQMRSGH
jgi:hypothetical protein